MDHSALVSCLETTNTIMSTTSGIRSKAIYNIRCHVACGVANGHYDLRVHSFDTEQQPNA